MMAPPSGGDALEVREAYLRRRRWSRSGDARRAAIKPILGAALLLLGLASFAVFVIGS